MTKTIEALGNEHAKIEQQYFIITGEKMEGEQITDITKAFYDATKDKQQTQRLLTDMKKVAMAIRKLESTEIEDAKRQSKKDGDTETYSKLKWCAFTHGLVTDQLRETYKEAKDIVSMYK